MGMSKNFQFSVKSAYYVEWDHKFGNNLRWSNGQGAPQNVSVWKKVWELGCPRKVGIYTWKVLHGTLACGVNLAQRHIKVSPQCPCCKEGADTTAHVLFQCPAARNVWEELALEKLIQKACLIDRAGESIFGFLLEMPHGKDA